MKIYRRTESIRKCSNAFTSRPILPYNRITNLSRIRVSKGGCRTKTLFRSKGLAAYAAKTECTKIILGSQLRRVIFVHVVYIASQWKPFDRMKTLLIASCDSPTLYHILMGRQACNSNIWYECSAKGAFDTLILYENKPRRKLRGKQGGKPGYVLGDHLSSLTVASQILRPT